MKKLMLALAIPALFANAAVARAATPAAMPAYGKEKPLSVPAIAKHVLPNGLQVWVIPRGGVPRVDFVLAVRGAGNIADDKDLPGFAAVLAGLLNEGTARRDSRAIAEAAQGMGGAISAKPEADGIVLSAFSLASQAAPMAALLAEVARHPAFPDREVELFKDQAQQRQRSLATNPRYLGDVAIIKAAFGDHPYASTQLTMASIAAVTAPMLRAEHAKRFRPDRSLLVITGSIRSAQALKLARETFGDWRAPDAPVPAAPKARGQAEPVRMLIDRAGSVQSALRVGRPAIAATAAEYVPLNVANTMLGVGISSRLNQNLRTQKGWTYSARSILSVTREGGAIHGGAEVRNDVTGAALAEYLGELRRIGTEPVPEDELSRTKRYMAGTYLIGNQEQRAQATLLANNWLNGLGPEYGSQYIPLVQKVTAEQVREVSRKYFAPETQSIVVVGDPKAVGEQLKAFGEFTVTDK